MKIDIESPILVIDTSYFIFYRYYATVTWYNLKNETKIKDVETALQTPEFMEKYDSLFDSTIVKLKKKYKANIIMAKDAPRHNIWRFDHYENYKKDRDATQQDNIGLIFEHTFKNIIPNILSKYNINILGHPRLEADDIAYIIHKTIRDKTKTTQIIFITNDNDYIQLHDDNTLIVNMQDIDLIHRIIKKGYSPETYLQQKIIMGDKSDCIYQIQEKIGPKRAEKLAKDKGALNTLLSNCSKTKENYERNALLIDMSKIPEEYIQDVHKQITI